MATTTVPAAAAAHPPARQPGRRYRGPGAYLVLAGLAVLALIMLAPFGLVAMNAVKSPTDFAAHGPLSLPRSLYFAGIRDFGRGNKGVSTFQRTTDLIGA